MLPPPNQSNQQSLKHPTPTTVAKGFRAQSDSSETPYLPSTDVTQDKIDNAKTLLSKECRGISYREVLQQISETPWTFSTTDLASTQITKKLLEFNRTILSEYEEKLKAEGTIDLLVASIPFFGRPLASDQLLKELYDVNQIIQDMVNGGLIKIKYPPPEVIIGPGRQFPALVGCRSLTVSVSDLGKMSLHS